MKKVFLTAILFSFCFCSFAQKEVSPYISENFVFMGVKAVKVAKQTYVKQVIARDFNTRDNSKVTGFGIGDEMFTDDGKHNDKVANDGVYTSVDLIKSEKLTENEVIISDKVVYGTKFKFQKDLEGFISSNAGTMKFGIKVKCDVNSCTCAQCHCRACNYNWGQNLNWCFELKNCSVEIGYDL